MNRAMLIAPIVAALIWPAAVLGAAPPREVLDLNDPALDAEETAYVSSLCGFPITAEVSGRISFTTLADGSRPGTFALDVYGIRVTYVNPETGAVLRLRDIGPDRFYVQDGAAYVAVTGRSETGTGVVGVVKIDLATNEVVHEAGKNVGFIYDRLCTALD